MKFLQSVALAAIAARADMISEDDDLSFVRRLQSNSSNNTATTTTTTTTTTDPNATTTTTTTTDPNATTTTTTTTDPNATTTTTTTTTTMDPNATTTTTTTVDVNATTTVAATTLAATTTDPNATTTVAATTAAATTTAASGGKEPETEAPKTKGSKGSKGGKDGDSDGAKTLPPMPKKEPKANMSNDTEPIEVVLTSEVTIEPPFTPPEMSSSLRLRRLSTELHKAYNLFCSAFTLTSGLVACQALQAAGQIPADGANDGAAQYAAGTVLFPSVDYCQVGITAMVSGTNCADTAGDSKGACLTNGAQNGMSMHEGCTMHQATSTAAYKYKTETKFTIPAAEVSADVTAGVAAAKTASVTKMADPSTVDALQSYIVVAVVEMAKDPAVKAAVNLTESFGMDDAAIAAAQTAIDAGGATALVASIVADDGTAPTSFTDAVTSVKAANPSIADVTITSTTVTASSTSGASAMFSFGIVTSMLAVLASILA